MSAAYKRIAPNNERLRYPAVIQYIKNLVWGSQNRPVYGIARWPHFRASLCSKHLASNPCQTIGRYIEVAVLQRAGISRVNCISIIYALYFVLKNCFDYSAQFVVQPVSVVQAEGIDAVFECLYNYADAVTHNWGINGTFPADALFPTDITRTLTVR